MDYKSMVLVILLGSAENFFSFLSSGCLFQQRRSRGRDFR